MKILRVFQAALMLDLFVGFIRGWWYDGENLRIPHLGLWRGLLFLWHLHHQTGKRFLVGRPWGDLVILMSDSTGLTPG